MTFSQMDQIAGELWRDWSPFASLEAANEATPFFADSYELCRKSFREEAAKIGAQQECIEIGQLGPDGQELTIDLAWVGPAQPKRLLVHVSGTHGVEGFAGSAIQSKLLGGLPETDEDTAILFVHSMNPYGQAWLQRWNENRVDLNRNWDLAYGEESAPEERPAAEAYQKINEVINPPAGDEGYWDRPSFLTGALWSLATSGFSVIKEAVAQGQRSFEDGLFFAGKELEAGPRKFLDWFLPRAEGLEKMVLVDVHTGLGPYGEDTLLCSHEPESPEFATLHQHLGARLQKSDTNGGVAYVIAGGVCDGVAKRVGCEALTVLQEFGVYNNVSTLYALRQELKYHLLMKQKGEAPDLTHPAKQRVKATFCSKDPWWQKKIMDRGLELFDQCWTMLKA